ELIRVHPQFFAAAHEEGDEREGVEPEVRAEVHLRFDRRLLDLSGLRNERQNGLVVHGEKGKRGGLWCGNGRPNLHAKPHANLHDWGEWTSGPREWSSSSKWTAGCALTERGAN